MIRDVPSIRSRTCGTPEDSKKHHLIQPELSGGNDA